MTPDPHDPKGLIREAHVIPGITEAECRSIFLDWALSLPAGADLRPSVQALLDRYGGDHPMTAVLRAALVSPQSPRRRGGRAGRLAEG